MPKRNVPNRPVNIPYRPDIDGLRAVAILAVLLFHAHLPGFGGGYVGVDVFFVISGYLITQILTREIAEDRFSLLHFYERRVRRIVPALAVVLAFVVVAGALILVPFDFRQTAQGIFGAVTFTSNFVFWRQAGYFGAGAQFKPLLHTWSLAIEEQFYLLYPPFLFLMRKRPRWQLGFALTIGFVLSLLFCVLITRGHQGAAFYFSPSRAWELLLGCLIALYPARTLDAGRNEVLSALGILAVGVSIATFSSAPRFLFPGYFALLPCAGAGLIIYSNAQKQTWVGRILSMRPVVFVGLISYSLYLWNWPLLALTRAWILIPLSLELRVMLLAVTFILAVFSWKWIEQPFRKRSGGLARRQIFASAAAIGFLLLVFASWGIYSGGWPGRMAPFAAAMSNYSEYHNTPIGRRLFGPEGCHTGQNGFGAYANTRCFVTQPEKANILLWGDSHAGHLSLPLSELLDKNGGHLLQATKPACPSLLGEGSGITRNCAQFNNMVEALAEKTAVDGVVVSAKWNHYWSENSGEERSAAMSGLYKALRPFQARHIPIVIVGQSPVYLAPLPTILARAAEAQQDIDERASMMIDPAVFGVDRQMKKDLGNLPGVTYISVLDRLCPQHRCMSRASRNVPLFFDTDHLTYEGSSLLLAATLKQPILAIVGRHCSVLKNGVAEACRPRANDRRIAP